MVSNLSLHEYTADEILNWIAKAQDELLDAEADHAIAKGRFEAIQGAVMDEIKRNGHPVEIAKKLIWDDERIQKAHEEYLEAWGRHQKARNQDKRMDDALRLWQTVRADVRKV